MLVRKRALITCRDVTELKAFRERTLATLEDNTNKDLALRQAQDTKAAEDLAVLRKIPWKYMVVDEAHRLKNDRSALSQDIRSLQVDQIQLLTVRVPIPPPQHPDLGAETKQP